MEYYEAYKKELAMSIFLNLSSLSLFSLPTCILGQSPKQSKKKKIYKIYCEITYNYISIKLEEKSKLYKLAINESLKTKANKQKPF